MPLEIFQLSSIGPFFGLATNLVMTILCLVTFILYRHYRPLGWLMLFYISLSLFFFGYIIYGAQKSPDSILMGYRINLVALALLPATWVWFASSLLNERAGPFSWAVTGISLLLAGLVLWGNSPLLLGLPLELHPTGVELLRPQSKLLRPLVSLFGLLVCFYYFWLVTVRLWHSKGRPPIYLLPFGIGLLLWFLGGVHDGLLTTGVVTLARNKVLWIASFWLSISLTIAIALHYRLLEQDVRQTRAVFERFVPSAYLRRIAAEGLQSIQVGAADQQDVIVLCCDIRGFTQLSERISPQELIAFVNKLFERITRVATDQGGVIDKFLGDAVLCIFEGTDSALRAVTCGINMLAAVKSFNIGADQPIRVGIGLHKGQVILGTIGTSERMDSTVIGFAVNMAKRLEELTEHLGVDMLISKQVASCLPSGQPFRFREIGEVRAKGVLSLIAISEVYEQDPAEIRDLKDRTKPIMTEAIDLYRSGLLEPALSKFLEAQRIFPQDVPLRRLVESVKSALEHGQIVKGAALVAL